MQIVVTIPPPLKQEVIDSFCEAHNYRDTIMSPEGNTPNPESKEDFMVRLTREFVRNSVVQAQMHKAEQAARESKSAEVLARVKLT